MMMDLDSNDQDLNSASTIDNAVISSWVVITITSSKSNNSSCFYLLSTTVHSAECSIYVVF